MPGPVQIPSAMSAGSASSRSCRAKANPIPSRAAIAVTVATSEVSEMAGRAGLPTITGCTNSTATCWASVLARAAAERDELAPAAEPGGHVQAGRGHLPGLLGELTHRLLAAAEQGLDLGRPGGGHDGSCPAAACGSETSTRTPTASATLSAPMKPV